MLRHPLVTDDPFWRARTEDAHGRIRADSRLADVEAWRAMRLSTDLTEQLYRRAGYAPVPRTDDLLTGFVLSQDCAAGTDDVIRAPGSGDAASWAELVEQRLSGVELPGGHERCRHAQPQAMVPLMWQVALMLRTTRGVRPGPFLRAVPYERVHGLIGGPTALASAFDRDGTWFLIHSTAMCALSPTGGAYFADGFIDLAGMWRNGSTAGELAATVEDQLTGALPMAALVRRAGLEVPPVADDPAVPPWLRAFQDDTATVLGVPWGVSQRNIDAALGLGLVHMQDRDLHLILPAGSAEATCRRVAFLQPQIRVWVHDGFRVTPAPIPARDELYAAARTDSWRQEPPAPETRLEQVLSTRHAGWQRLGRFTRGRDHIDLARDPGRTLRVVVDASDPDVLTVLHGIDRWIWATACRDELRRVVDGIPEHDPVMLTFVVGDPDGSAVVNPWTDVQLEMLPHWPLRSELIRVSRYDSPEPVIDVEQTAPWSTSPVSGERPAPRWAARLLGALIQEANGRQFTDPETTLLDSARQTRRELVANGIQPATYQVDSTPAFAINLFGPLTGEGVAAIFEAQGMPVVKAEPPRLFRDDPHGRLGEGFRPDETRIDVLLEGFSDRLERVALLICVKLLAENFDACRHHESRNPRRTACRTAVPFGGDLAACAQTHRRSPAETAPRYPDVLRPLTVAHPDGGCPFRVANEHMRYLALANALRESGDYAATRVLLCAPRQNETLWRRLEEASRPFQDPDHATLGALPAEQVLMLAEHPEAAAMRRRYRLGETARAAAAR